MLSPPDPRSPLMALLQPGPSPSLPFSLLALQAQPQVLLLAEAFPDLEPSDRPVNLRGCTRPTGKTTHSDIKMSQKFPRPAFP